MRALTLCIDASRLSVMSCNNEVLAREGIDTCNSRSRLRLHHSNNEVLAREGIDTAVIL